MLSSSLSRGTGYFLVTRARSKHQSRRLECRAGRVSGQSTTELGSDCSTSRREHLALLAGLAGAASIGPLTLAEPAYAIGFEKKLRKKVGDGDYISGEPFDWRGEKHDGLQYFDTVVGKGKPVEEGALLTVHFDCKYRSVVVVSSREARLLGGNRTLSEPLEFKYGVIPEQFLRPKKRKTVVGVGIELRLGTGGTLDDGLLVVQDTTRSGPAYNAGIRPLDRITAIDGTSTSGLTAAEVGKALAGAEGSTITFTVLKGGATGEATTAELKREAVPVKPKEGQPAFDGPAGGLFTGNTGPKPPPALWLAVAGMKEGGKRTVVVPPDVGYDDVGFNEIPPDATIVMDIEILSVRKPSTA